MGFKKYPALLTQHFDKLSEFLSTKFNLLCFFCKVKGDSGAVEKPRTFIQSVSEESLTGGEVGTLIIYPLPR